MKNILGFILLFFATNSALAQPIGNANEQRKENMKKANESLNAVYEANRPNGSSKTTNILGSYKEDAKPYEPSAYEKRLDQDRIDRAKAINSMNEQKRLQYLNDKIYFKYSYCKTLFDNEKLTNPIVLDNDLKELSQWRYADTYGGTKYYVSYLVGINRLRDYLKDSANGNFDSCMSRLWDAAMFPNTCIRELNKLKKRFPEKVEKIEKQELYTMKYLFGGFIPNYEELNGDLVYPKCQYEVSNLSVQIEILNRFLNLYYKHSIFALDYVVGKTRIKFNPLLMVTTVNEYFGGISQELMFKMHRSILLIKAPEPAAVYKTKQMEEVKKRDLFKARCEKSSNFLLKYYALYVATMSPQEWIDIATFQGVELKDIMLLFTDDVKNYKKNLPNLKNAMDGKLEPFIKDGFNTIETENKMYDRGNYVGNFVNGKPNGQGKFKGGTSVNNDYYFEGIFKNAHPTNDGIFTDRYGKKLNYEGLDFADSSFKKIFIKVP